MKENINHEIITQELIEKLPDSELIEILDEYFQNFGQDHIVSKMANQYELFRDIHDAIKRKGIDYNPKIIRLLTDGKDFDHLATKSNMMKLIRNLQFTILQDTFEVPNHNYLYVPKKNSNEMRKITVPNFTEEHLIHHALIRVIKDKLDKSFYYYSAASIPGKGTHFCRKHIWKNIATDHKNTKYVLKMDIHHFFYSIPHRLLKSRLKKIIKDPLIRSIISKVIDSTEKGIPLGFYTSVWFANFYLTPLDHYIKERICDDIGLNTKRTKRHGAVYYYRYLDDILIFGPNKKELHLMRKKISEILDQEYGLKLRKDWQVFRFDYIDKDGKRRGRPLDFVGFIFYHDKITVGKHTYSKIMNLTKILKSKNIREITCTEACAMISYCGLIYWTDARGIYYKLIRPYIKLKELKRIVRREQKKKMQLVRELNV